MRSPIAVEQLQDIEFLELRLGQSLCGVSILTSWDLEIGLNEAVSNEHLHAPHRASPRIVSRQVFHRLAQVLAHLD